MTEEAVPPQPLQQRFLPTRDSCIGPNPASSSSSHSDQFEDAPEDSSGQQKWKPNLPGAVNPLEALAMACATEKDLEEAKGQVRGASPASPSPFRVSHNDVLCGRGGLTNHHPGNVFFRRLVRLKQEAYLLASKREKAGVAKEIVELIRNLAPPGRFLKKDPKNPGVWVEIGDRKAREKTSQALREGAPELREELQTADLKVPETTPSQHADSHRMAEAMRGQRPAPSPHLYMDKSMYPTFDERHSHHPNPGNPIVVLSSPEGTPDKPHPVDSNRPRVVSDDAGVRGLRPLFHKILPDNLVRSHLVMDDMQQRFMPPAHLHQMSVQDTQDRPRSQMHHPTAISNHGLAMPVPSAQASIGAHYPPKEALEQIRHRQAIAMVKPHAQLSSSIPTSIATVSSTSSSSLDSVQQSNMPSSESPMPMETDKPENSESKRKAGSSDAPKLDHRGPRLKLLKRRFLKG